MEPVQISDNGEDEFIYRIAHPFLDVRKFRFLLEQ